MYPAKPLRCLSQPCTRVKREYASTSIPMSELFARFLIAFALGDVGMRQISRTRSVSLA
ncbi:hypothetical protein F511_40269 [Dorcoceras hygrometricum]|uniref:Uncharacterized protein n=1 Tax=Dorcoceras hygrometricum TaxID=472368 RepID=A0A2Z7BUU9_9LAMI|nr:hypothetical protein F511_40269 [Dorcoceras hygrometricum]